MSGTSIIAQIFVSLTISFMNIHAKLHLLAEYPAITDMEGQSIN